MAFGAAGALAVRAGQAASGKRIALVIGNNAYQSCRALHNAVNDATAIAQMLKSFDFQVISVSDANNHRCRGALDEFAQLLRGVSAQAVVYYAGHGVQVDWRNYLIPTDFKPTSNMPLSETAISVDSVTELLKRSGTLTNILILDACRDNPVGFTVTGTGLAQMDAPPGTLLAYATAPGHTAADGDSAGHGIYTGALLSEIERVGASVEEIFKRVRLRVRLESGGQQVPWESTSLEESFFFRPALQSEDSDKRRLELEAADWHVAEATNSVEAWTAYIRKYPNGFVTTAAQHNLDQLLPPKVLPVYSPLSASARPDDAIAPGETLRHEGDEFRFQKTDGYTGLQVIETWKVVRSDALRVDYDNGSATDQQGNLIVGHGGEKYDPPRIVVPAQWKIGEVWKTASRVDFPAGGSNNVVVEWKVVTREVLKTPAGLFDTFKISATAVGSGETAIFTNWFDARSTFLVKTRRWSLIGGYDRYESELVSATWLEWLNEEGRTGSRDIAPRAKLA